MFILGNTYKALYIQFFMIQMYPKFQKISEILLCHHTVSRMHIASKGFDAYVYTGELLVKAKDLAVAP